MAGRWATMLTDANRASRALPLPARKSHLDRAGWRSPPAAGRLPLPGRGWANYYHHGQVGPAYSAINNHSTRRLRQWLCRKHKVKSGKYVRYPNPRLWKHYGLTCLEPKTQGLPWAKA